MATGKSLKGFCVPNLVSCEAKTRNRRLYESWMVIQDIVGPAKEWPRLIRRLFWTRNVTHKWRPIIAAFVFVNGLNPEIFLEWALLKGLCRDTHAYREMKGFLSAFEENPSKWTKFYGYQVTMRRFEDIYGNYVPPPGRKKYTK